LTVGEPIKLADLLANCPVALLATA
jgi:hypothetical protein